MRALGIVNMAVLARLLAPEDFGLVAMAMVAAGLIDGILNAGIDRVILQRGHGDRAYYDTAWSIRLCQGLVVAACIAAVAAPAAAYYGEPRVETILLLSAGTSALRGFESLGVVLLQQQLRFERELVFQVCVQLVGVVATILLARELQDYRALVYGVLLKEISETLLSYAFAPYRPRFTFVAWRELAGISQWSLALNMVANIYGRLPNLILGRLADADALGRFNVSRELAMTPTSEIAAPLMRTFFPGFVKLRDEEERYRSALLVSFTALLLIACAVCLGLALVAHEFVALVLGPKWQSAGPLVQIFAVAALFRTIEMFFIEQVFVFARIKETTFVFAVAMVAFALAIGPVYRHFDLAGAAMLSAVMAALGAAATASIAASAAGLRLTELVRCARRPAAAGAVMTLGVLALGHAVQLPPWLMLLVKATLGATLFIGTAALLWHVDGCPHGIEQRLRDKFAEMRGWKFRPR